MPFENSKQYKEAKQKWVEETYKDLLNPINVIIKDKDEVYLFYPQNKVDDIFKTLSNIWTQQQKTWGGGDEPEIDINLGYNEPKLVNYTFMEITYKVVYLWYDNNVNAIPTNFKA